MTGSAGGGPAVVTRIGEPGAARSPARQARPGATVTGENSHIHSVWRMRNLTDGPPPAKLPRHDVIADPIPAQVAWHSTHRL